MAPYEGKLKLSLGFLLMERLVEMKSRYIFPFSIEEEIKGCEMNTTIRNIF